MRRTTLNNRRGYAGVAILWLIAWLAVGGLLLYRAAPKKHDTLAASSAPRVQLARTTEPPSSYRTKNIEDVQAGEWVWSCDPVSGQWSRGQVVRPLVHDYAGDVVTVAAGGDRLDATGNHPFWVVAGEGLSARADPHDVSSAERDAIREATSGRWVEARSLQPGDLLLLRSGATATVEELYSRQVEQKVYNLEVAGLHTYAVGGDGVLVHNKAMLNSAPSAPYAVVSPADDLAILKSIRSHTERLVSGKAQPGSARTAALVAQTRRALALGDNTLAGTYYHSLNFRFARAARRSGQLQQPYVRLNRFLRTPGGFSPYRIPDYRFDYGGGYQFVYDLKPWQPSPNAYNTTRQFRDINSVGYPAVPLYYRLQLP